MTEQRDFPIADILTATTGRIVNHRGVRAIHELLSWLAGQPVGDEELPSSLERYVPLLLTQHPWLLEVSPPCRQASKAEIGAWVAKQRVLHGNTLTITAPDKENAPRFPQGHPAADYIATHAFTTRSMQKLTDALAARRDGREWTDLPLFLSDIDELHAPATPDERAQIDAHGAVVVPIVYAAEAPPGDKVPAQALDALAAMAHPWPGIIGYLAAHMWDVDAGRWERRP